MELTLEAGDIIEVIEKRADGWWFGKCNGHIGLFPSHFVVELDADKDENEEAQKESAATGNASPESKSDS